MTTDKSAAAALKRLNAFVGTWDTTGEMKDVSPALPARFKAVDKYEWLPGGKFLIHRFEADMPDGKVQGIEIIGYDSEQGSYPMHSFDSTGTAGVMSATVDKDGWAFTGELLRFAGGFREGGRVFTGLWESRDSAGAGWQPLMEVTLRKVG